jgi:hypothetical protein
MLLSKLKKAGCLLPADFDSVNYPYDRCINRAVLTAESHARRASLNDQHDFIDARAYRVNHDHMAFLVLAVHVDKARDEELAPEQPLIFARSDYSSDNSCKNHNQGSRASRNNH